MIEMKNNVLVENHKKKIGQPTFRIVIVDVKQTIYEQNRFAP